MRRGQQVKGTEQSKQSDPQKLPDLLIMALELRRQRKDPKKALYTGVVVVCTTQLHRTGPIPQNPLSHVRHHFCPSVCLYRMGYITSIRPICPVLLELFRGLLKL